MTKNEALKLALEALEGIHPGNMTPMAEEYWNKAITAIKQALAAPVQEPVACLVGMKGSAFDTPKTKRAYTYAEQPGNAAASKLGNACNTSAQKSAGDCIDRGLGLLQELQKEGFGVFDLGAEYTITPPAAPVQEPVETGDTLFRQFMLEAKKAGITNWPTPPAAPIKVSAGPITPEMRRPITPERRAELVSAMQGVFPTAHRQPLTDEQISVSTSAPMSQNDIAQRLRRLAYDVVTMGCALDYYGGFGPLGDKGRALCKTGVEMLSWSLETVTKE